MQTPHQPPASRWRRREAEEDVRTRREEVAKNERRLAQAEEQLEKRLTHAETQAAELEQRDEKLKFVREQLEKATEGHRLQVERIAAMTAHEAREHLVASVLDDAKRAAMTQVREIEQRAREEG